MTHGDWTNEIIHNEANNEMHATAIKCETCAVKHNMVNLIEIIQSFDTKHILFKYLEFAAVYIWKFAKFVVGIYKQTNT